MPVPESIVKRDFQQERRTWPPRASIVIVFACIAFISLFSAQAKAQLHAPIFSARIVAQYPHDPAASTQGLAFHKDMLLESTGKYGSSTVRMVSLNTGKVLTSYALPHTRFGEGLAVIHDQIHVLTWRSGQGYRFSIVKEPPHHTGQKESPSFHELGSFFIRPDKGPARAWGLTTDGSSLIMSNGTNTLSWHEPETFRLMRKISVHDGSAPVSNINELEWVNERIWANIWKTATIAVINPDSGMVEAWVDVSPLLANMSQRAGVANGIAFHGASSRLFVTGKLWETLFEIEVPGLFPFAPQ